MASRSDIPETYSGKNATFVKQGQEPGKKFGQNPQPEGGKSDAATKAVGNK